MVVVSSMDFYAKYSVQSLTVPEYYPTPISREIYPDEFYTDDVAFWDHYHPTNTSMGFYPSIEDQNHAKELNGARCTIFYDGLSMDFHNLVPSHPNGYINIAKFRQLWNSFAR